MKTDARVRYTKMVIRDSLLTLLTEKPIQKITVKEICELAGINRATFYTHYHDPFDLLEQIENELFENIDSMVITEQYDPNHLTKRVFEVIGENADLCKVLFSENGDKMFLRRIMDLARDSTIADWHKQYPHTAEQQLDYLYTFIISGSVAVIEQWVRMGMRGTPLELGDLAKKLIDIGLRASK